MPLGREMLRRQAGRIGLPVLAAFLGVMLAAGQAVWEHGRARPAGPPAAPPFPAVVATVNGRPILGAALANRLAATRGGTPGEGAGDALDALIAEESLFQIAEAAGQGATADEGAAYARTQQHRAAAGDPAARALLAAVTAEAGVPAADRPDDPRVREAFRRHLTLARLRGTILAALPPARRDDPAAQRAAVAAFVARDDRQVVILLPR